MAKTLVNSQKMLGKKGITVPDESSSDEERQAFREALGIPDSAENYELSEVELPETIDTNNYEQFTEEFKKLMADAEIPQDKADKVWQAYHEWIDRGVQQNKEQTEAEQAKQRDELRKEWGREMEHNEACGEHALKQLGYYEQLQELGVADNPVVKRLANDVYNYIGEDTLGEPGGQSSQDAQSEINSIVGNPNDPYFDKNHPQHQERVQHMRKLDRQIHGE